LNFNIQAFVLKQNTTLFPFLFVAINLVFRSIGISYNSLAGDEPFSVYYAQMSLSDIIAILSGGNNPPLYEIILHYWISIFGISPLSVRFPSLIFTSITAYFIYKIAYKYISFRAALIAVSIYTFSNYHLYFAHEARVYALFGMLSILSMYAFLAFLKHPFFLRGRILWLCFSVLLCYAHYFGFFILFIQCIVYLYSHYKRTEVLKIGRNLSLIFCLCYLPNVYTLSLRLLDSTQNGTWLAPPEGLKALYIMLWEFSNTPVVTVLCLLLLLSSGVLAFIGPVKTKRPAYLLIILWFLLPFLLMYLVSYIVPMFHNRYLMFLAVAYPLLLSLAIEKLPLSSIYKTVISLFIVGAFGFTAKTSVHNQRDVKAFVQNIKIYQKSNTAIVLTQKMFTPAFTYYYNRNYFNLIDNKMFYGDIHSKLLKEHIYIVDSFNELPLDILEERVIYAKASNQSSVSLEAFQQYLPSSHKLTMQLHSDQFFEVYVFEPKSSISLYRSKY